MANQVVERRAKKNWVTPVAVAGGIGAAGFGMWWYFRKKAGGAITGIWVNKGSDSKKPIPYITNADGQTFEIGVSYKNTGKEAVILGAEVVVTKPDGDLVQPTVDMAGADVGEVLSVEYNISKVDQVGEWPITVRIITEKGDVLDEFSGVVLNVVEEVAEGDWGGPGVILAKGQFETLVTQAVPGDWMPPNAELDRVSFEALVEAGVPGGWLPPDTELDRVSFSVNVTGGGVPGPEAPEIDVDPAKKITPYTATLEAELVEEGFCSGAYCYIEWGKTTSFGHKSNPVRIWGGQSIKVEVEGLERDTKYYFRAVAEGRCVTPYLIGYSQTRNFRTEDIPTTELFEITDIYYFEGNQSYNSPPTVPLGSRGGVQINYKNTSGETLRDVHAEIHLYPPSGSGKACGSSTSDMEPGLVRGMNCKDDLDQEGTWKVDMWIDVEGEVVWQMPKTPFAYVE